jgi:hypothetical protein
MAVRSQPALRHLNQALALSGHGLTTYTTDASGAGDLAGAAGPVGDLLSPLVIWEEAEAAQSLFLPGNVAAVACQIGQEPV